MPAATPAGPSPGGRGARARILSAALDRFRQQGINATGVAELASVAHVSKRTLYQHFPSKDEVAVAYLRVFEQDPERCAEGALARNDLTPRARLLELYSALGAQSRPLRGCPFATAAAEFPDPAHPVHRFAAGHKQRFIATLIELARAAGARPAEPVGRRLALLYDGAAAQTAALNSPEPAGEAFAVAAAMLDAAIA